MATKAKMEALAQLVETMQKFGDYETKLRMEQMEDMNQSQEINEDREKADARITAQANNFATKMNDGMQQQQEQPLQQQEEEDVWQ